MFFRTTESVRDTVVPKQADNWTIYSLHNKIIKFVTGLSPKLDIKECSDLANSVTLLAIEIGYAKQVDNYVIWGNCEG